MREFACMYALCVFVCVSWWGKEQTRGMKHHRFYISRKSVVSVFTFMCKA